MGARFPTHHAFAGAQLADGLGAEVFAAAAGFDVSTAASGVRSNDGPARFRFEPLPWPAQVAPVFGLAVADFDGDGHEDVVVAQNFFDAHRETSRMNGGAGLLLHGRGDGGFEASPPVATGLVLPRDNRTASTPDLNDDGWPDLVVAVRNGALLASENRASPGIRRLAVRLRGAPGNPGAWGRGSPCGSNTAPDGYSNHQPGPRDG